MLTAVFIISITLIGYILSLTKGPVWGLIAYANLYFNTPSPHHNWWAVYLPDLRWSLLSVGVILASMIIHRQKLSTHKLSFFYFVFILYILAELLTNTIAVDPIEAREHTYDILTYSVIIILIIKSLAEFGHLRLFILIIIGLAAFLGIQGVLEGKLIDGRLNSIGPADANGSNSLGLLLCSIIPLTLPFIVHGKMYEKAICFLSFPLILNGFTLTVSRGALVSLIFSVVYVFFFVANKKIKRYMLVASICVLPVFFYFVDESYVNRISSLWETDTGTDKELNELSTGRMDVWRSGFVMVQDYPFGAGPGGFRELSRFYMPEENLTFDPGAKYGFRAAHNSFLLVLVELGYLGIVIFMIICFGTMYMLFQSSKKITQMGEGGTFIGLFIIALNMSVACTLFGGLFGSHFYYEFFWWQVALAAVVKSFVMNMEQNYLNEQMESLVTGIAGA